MNNCPSYMELSALYHVRFRQILSIVYFFILLSIYPIIQFIQPQGKSPSQMLQLCVTEFGLKFLPATMFYFPQHLLKKYYTPRYAFPDPAFHFKNYSPFLQSRGEQAESITSNNTYLYNRRDKSEIGMFQDYLNFLFSWCIPLSK